MFQSFIQILFIGKNIKVKFINLVEILFSKRCFHIIFVN